MTDKTDFTPVARLLRDRIIEHYWALGERIDDESGLRTLDTNSTLVPQRARLLADLVARRRGSAPFEGLEVADLGCGFGAMSLWFAASGARVVGVDPNAERLEVGALVASELALDASFQRGWVEALPLPDSSFDLIVVNNSLCYVTDRSDRSSALTHALRVVRPGGWIVMRNPSIGSPVDPFTGLPMVHQVPARLVRPVLSLSRRGRSRSRVKLLPSFAARRELRRAGFESIKVERGAHERRPHRYQHLTARRPGP